MWIKNFQFANYKSFLETQEIELKQGFNVIVGKNNVGKTALIEALSLKYGNNPHKSLTTLEYRGEKLNSILDLKVEIEISTYDLKYFAKMKQSLLVFGATEYIPEIITKLNSETKINMKFSMKSDGVRIIKIADYEIERIKRYYHYINFNSGKFVQNSEQAQYQNNLTEILFTELVNNIFKFDAERLKIGDSPISDNNTLSQDAINLAQVLHNLSNSNKTRFERFLGKVKTIFPEITDISTPVSPGRSNSHVEIKLWTFDRKTERDDLTVNLSQSGTGISQILAILYVVITSENPRIILIDEPQSFLHPGAVRKLFEILRTEFSQHQYIITTHSPTAISSADPQTILLVKKDGFESRIEVIDTKSNSDKRIFLEELGASLSDVFGADRVLWVEGDTEKNCFPIIIEKIVEKHLYGTTIASIKHTGDFNKKQSQLTIEIYKRLTESNSLIPPALAFVFDRENRSQQDIEDLIRQGKKDGKDSIYFIGEMMFENYLLNPTAIQYLVNSIGGFSKEPISIDQIQEKLKDGRKNHKEHGAKILESLFEELSESRVSYQKVHYGIELTKWICENSPNDFEDLKKLFEKILG